METTGNNFTVHVQLAGTGTPAALQITHADETFSAQVNEVNISIINNGDNSWSLVTGQLEQEDVNAIGEAIEQYYQQQDLQ